MKVGVVGSRDYPDLMEVERFVHAFDDAEDEAWIISGGARGVDETAETTAMAHGFAVSSYRPRQLDNGLWTADRWEYRGWDVVRADTDNIVKRYFSGFAQAAFFRNGLIIEEAEKVVAFWDGESHGTLDSIKKAEAAGKLAHVFNPTSRVGDSVGEVGQNLPLDTTLMC